MTLHAIANLFATVMPTLGNWAHHHRPFVLVAGAIAYAVLQRATASTTDALEHALGEAVREALHLARLTEKNAADVMRMDESHLRKALRGEPSHHISLTRLVRLPLAFWMFFGPTLIYLVARQHAQDIAHDFGVRTHG